MKNIGFWLIVVGAVLAVLFVIGKFVFPELVTEFAALIVAALTFITGLFLRRKKTV